MRRPSWRLLGVCAALAAGTASSIAACGTDSADTPSDNRSPTSNGDGSSDFCATPNDGCPCEIVGDVAACGKVTSVFGQYVTCSEGKRTCDGTKWGECVGEYVTQKVVPSLQFSALGLPTSCSDDPCSPYCTVQQDTPDGLDAGPEFSTTDSGLTLGGGGGGLACTSLTISASSTTLDVTNLSPLTATGNPITLTAIALPAGCAPDPFPTTWVIDRSDRALMTGNQSDNGTLTLAVPIAGTINVVAYGAGLVSVPLPITVTVHATQTTAVSPNTTASAAQIGTFTGAGTVASTITWLYPYNNTYYPLGLLAPVMQYKFSTAPVTTGIKNAVRFSLRYPATAVSEAAATFNYSIIVDEPTPDPQVTIPQSAWNAFAQSARGQDGSLIIQRWRGGTAAAGKLEYENKQTIHIVDAQLKGTVYYTSYNSAIGGTLRSGAVLAIKPGATQPTIAVPNFTSNSCTTCHTVNAQGTRMIAAGGEPSAIGLYNKGNSAVYDIVNGTRKTFFSVGNAKGTLNAFNWSAPYPDGSFYMTGACDNYQGARNPSQLLRTEYGGLLEPTFANLKISLSGWATTNATSPTFSPDGRLLAWTVGSTSYNAATCKVVAGTTIKVVSFDCQAPTGSVTCGADTTQWKASNERTLVSGSNVVGHAAFLPNNAGLVYQKVITEASRFTGETNGSTYPYFIYLSPLVSSNGALSEIWLGSVPTSGNAPTSGSGSPILLKALNGYNADGTTSYLPTTARDITPSLTKYHVPGSSIKFILENHTATSANMPISKPVYDYKLNYAPTVNPSSTGGFHWVIFQSRRMYGNIAAGNPWGQESCTVNCGGYDVSTTAPLIEPKKLWVSAIDGSWTKDGDPSHPAFYLPGQELTSGNSRAYWVDTPCSDVGASCDSDDDCCGATEATPTTQCQIDTPLTSPPTKHCQARAACTAVGQGCSDTSDCCSGLICPTGGGACLATGGNAYEQQVFTREYTATCPPGSRVAWRFFSWKSTIPASTSIDFAIQTKAKATDSYLPVSPLLIASSTTTATAWTHGTQTSDDVLKANGLSSMAYLKVSMTFNPTPSLAPTLNAWEQKYDCVPAE